MPTYDYVCQACDVTFERFQKMSDGMLRKCPECGKLKLKRLMGTGAGIIFKGSGFYETDYKRKSPGNGTNGKSHVSSVSGESKAEAPSSSTTSGDARSTADTASSKGGPDQSKTKKSED